MAINTAYGLHVDYPEWLVERVEVPTGETYKVGEAIVAETLRTGSLAVYAGSQVADILTEKPLVIIDQRFEEQADGRRPDGSNILTDIDFTEGMVITGIRAMENLKFEFATDVLGNTGVVAPAVDVYIIPANGQNKWQTSATIGTALVAFKIEALATLATGGNMSLGYDASVITRCVLA